MILSMIKNQKGVALLSVYVASAFITVLAASAFGRAFLEQEYVDREVGKIQSYAAAEAGIQRAMWQVGQNAYTGFINTTDVDPIDFTNVTGVEIGEFSADIEYPDQADWVTIKATGSVNGETKILEARVFLDSNLAKYLVYADTGTFSSGNDAQYGEPNGTDPNGVPSNEDDRTMMYFTGNWSASGSNVHVYGDVHAEGSISGNSSGRVFGDTYVSSFTQNGSGNVTNDGVSGSMVINDGFSDDLDRNGDGVVNSTDRPDHHDLTQYGEDDSHAKEEIVAMDLNFYANNSNTPQFASGASQTRYLEFVADPGSSSTRIVEYSNSSFQNVSNSYNLPSTAIVYVKGDAYVRGEIQGRVSIAASDDIMLVGNMTYAGGQTLADATHSAAFLAKDKLYFMANQLEASGILYAENTSNSSVAFDAGYNTAGQYDPNSKDELRLHGNRVMNGSTNLGNYPDRIYGYDPKLKYYRPPGIPVVPTIRTVREVAS